jgi:hypothetical protein
MRKSKEDFAGGRKGDLERTWQAIYKGDVQVLAHKGLAVHTVYESPQVPCFLIKI